MFSFLFFILFCMTPYGSWALSPLLCFGLWVKLKNEASTSLILIWLCGDSVFWPCSCYRSRFNHHVFVRVIGKAWRWRTVTHLHHSPCLHTTADCWLLHRYAALRGKSQPVVFSWTCCRAHFFSSWRSACLWMQLSGVCRESFQCASLPDQKQSVYLSPLGLTDKSCRATVWQLWLKVCHSSILES